MSTTKKVLGRGLGALIPNKDRQPAPAAVQPAPAAPLSNGLLEVPIESITPNPYQPRRTFRSESLDELARSVGEHGVVQPLIVTRSGDGYTLIAGERRFRAAQKAGLTKVPVVVKELTGAAESLEIALIENIQREDLNPMEEALAYEQLHREFSLTQEEIAKRAGKERSTVANFMRLLKLPDEVKRLLAGRELSMGHARALVTVETAARQEELALRVVREGLSVRQTEQLVAGTPAVPKKQEKDKDVFTRDAEEKLTRFLRARVEIARAKKGGTIQIRFSGEDELIRLYEELTGGKSR